MIELAKLKAIQRAAEQMLTPLASAGGEQILAVLRPQPEDYARVFLGSAAATAQVGYTSMWNSPPRGLAKPGQTEVHASACDAESLRTENDFSQEFPGGYRGIAHLLVPDVVWVRFKFVEPGQRLGMAHDGLVQLGDRWAWFPKPWRILVDEGN